MKYTLTNAVNIKEVDVAIAAPVIPYLGIIKILSTTFISAHINDILNMTFTFPIPGRVPLIEEMGPYIKLPTNRINRGSYADRKSSLNNISIKN